MLVKLELPKFVGSFIAIASEDDVIHIFDEDFAMVEFSNATGVA